MNRTQSFKTRTTTPIFLMGLAAIGYIVCYATDSNLLREGAAAVAIISFCAGIATGLNWIFTAVFARLADYRIAIAAPEIERQKLAFDILTAAGKLTPEQAEAVKLGRIEIECTPGVNTRPIRTLVLPWARMPYTFVDEFHAHCDDTHLAPVGRWGEGSNKRSWAEALTRHMIEGRFATEASGPYPAAWVAGKIKAGWESIDFEPWEEEE